MVSQHALQVSRPIPRVEVEGDLAGGGVSRPTTKGEVERDLALGGLQAHTQGGTLLQGGSLLPGGCGDPPDGYCCGRYASYWNAFLFYECGNIVRVILIHDSNKAAQTQDSQLCGVHVTLQKMSL